MKHLPFIIAMILTVLTLRADELPDSLSTAVSLPADSLRPAPVDTLLRPIHDTSRDRITPVDIDDSKKTPVWHYYDKHGDLLKEPVLFLATLDTVTAPKAGPTFPAYNGFSVGISWGDLIMTLAGQKHSSYGISADVSLWNWLFPRIEVGVGRASYHPSGNNYSYRSTPALYGKIGFNYNFLYKSNTAYQGYVGFHTGYSRFTFDITDASIESGYWGESQTLNLPPVKAWAIYGEAVAGLKVRIVGPFALGWNVAWRFKFRQSRQASKPWFIPGYGTGPFNIAIHAYFTLSRKTEI